MQDDFDRSAIETAERRRASDEAFEKRLEVFEAEMDRTRDDMRRK
jgi:hypothetical protein